MTTLHGTDRILAGVCLVGTAQPPPAPTHPPTCSATRMLIRVSPAIFHEREKEVEEKHGADFDSFPFIIPFPLPSLMLVQ